MCSIIGQWDQWPKCALKCAVSRLFYSLHIYMHTSVTRVTAHFHAPCKCAVNRLSDVFMYLGSWHNDQFVDENVQWVNCLTLCTFTCARQSLGSLHVYMHLMCACKCAVNRLSDVFMQLGSGHNDHCVHENVQWASAHLHARVRHTGHCTFTWTWCVHIINVHWSDCPMCSCKWGVSRVTEMCMKCG